MFEWGRNKISPVYVYILRTPYFVTPLLGAGVHAGIEVCVVENDGVCVKHSSNCRAAAVGQDAAEHLPVPVELLHIFLQHTSRVGEMLWKKSVMTVLS